MDPVTAAVLDFVNAGTLAEVEWVLRSQTDILLSDAADAKLHSMIEHYRDEPDSVEHLRLRRLLLHDCREFGIERGLAPRPIAPEIESAVLQFFNLRENDLQAHVAAHLNELLDADAETVIRHLRLTYLDDDSTQEHLRQRIEMLDRVRYLGIDRAFEDSSVVITAEMNEAISALMQSTPSTLREVLERHAAVLLSDEAERLLMFIIDNAQPGAVTLMEELLSVLRAARAYGIETAAAATATSGIAVDTSEARRAFQTIVDALSASNWPRVIELGPQTLRLINREQYPAVWAVTHTIIGTALSLEPSGDRAAAIDASIDHHEQARRVLTAVEEPAWRMNEHHLAIAYLQRPRGNRTDNLERAITILRELIATVDPSEAEPEWHITLADALRQRQLGDRTENLHESVANLDAALAHVAEKSIGSARAKALLQLGVVYLDDQTGEPAENVEKAIDLLTVNLSALDLATDLTGWVHTARSLADAHLRRVLGDPLVNWQAALDLLAEITDACPKDRAPMLWAENQLAVAQLHKAHPDGSSPQRRRLELQLTESVLDVYTRNSHAALWAKVQQNLGGRYLDLGDFDKAAQHLDQAFEVYSRENAPQRWALIHNTFGDLFLHLAARGSADRPRLIETAIEHYERALDVRNAAVDPTGRLDLLRSIARLRFYQERWYDALATSVDAMRLADRLVATAHTETGRLMTLTGYDQIYGCAAYSLFQLNDVTAAAVCAEWGKSRMLARALAVRDLDLVGLPNATVQNLTATRQKIRRLDAQLRSEPSAAVSRERQRAQQTLVEAGVAGDAPIDPRLRMPEIGSTVPTPGAIVLPVITEAGAVLYVLLRGPDGQLQVRHSTVAWLNATNVRELLVGTDNDPGWIPRYQLWRERQLSDADWRASMRTDLAALWYFLGDPVGQALDGALPDGAPVTIVPDGALSFLPCHAAAPDGDGVGGLIERYAVGYSPSIYALRVSQRRLAALHSANINALAIVDPGGDLTFAHDEGAFLAAVAPRHEVLSGAEATLHRVTRAAAGRSHLHFACHGSYNRDDALRSGLHLADDTLTIGGILDPTMDLRHARLVSLSACETGLIDTRYAADEFIGLPTAFLQAGACGVISTLWPVNDRATSLLIQCFYQHHLVENLPPSQALRIAQLWLRDATGAELATDGSPNDRPYADPYYWAAFQYTGA